MRQYYFFIAMTCIHRGYCWGYCCKHCIGL